MKKILIISYYFPPLNVIASKRYGYMCKYMRDNGYEPYVLTLNSKGDIDVPISENNILRIGTAGQGKAFPETQMNLNFLQGAMFAAFDEMKLHMRSIDKYSMSWYNDIRNNLNKIKDRFNGIDVIIGTFGPIANIMCARYLSKELNIPWVADIRDLISQYEDDVPKGYKKSKILDLCIEKYLLSTASGIVTVTKGFKKILKTIYKKPVGVVYNGWDCTSVNTITLAESKEKYLYYAGYLYEHRLEALYILLNCLKEVADKSIKLIIRSTGPDVSNKKIVGYARKLGIEERIIVKESCSDSVVKQEQSSAMINVVLSDIREDKDYLLATIPGKVFELLNATSPVLAIASERSEMADIIAQTNKGIVSIDKKVIINFISGEYTKYSGDNKAVVKYSRKHQAKRLCKLLDAINL